MTSTVKRYSYGFHADGFGEGRTLGLIEKEDGNLVRYEDYELLREERDSFQRVGIRAAEELDAIRKQEPVAIECGLSNGDGTYSVHIKRYPLPSYMEPHKDHPTRLLYAAPPAAAMDGGMAEELRKQHDLAWDTAGTILEKLSKANVEVDRLAAALEQYADDGNWCYDTCNISRDVAKEALATHRQASQQEGEKK